MAQNREQEKIDSHQTEAPLLCVNNCGLFGCPTTMNLCSRCYKDLHVKMEGNHVSPKALVGQHDTTVSALVSKVPAKANGDDVANSASTGVSSPSLVAVTTQDEAFMIPGSTTGRSLAQPLLTQKVISTGSTRCVSCRKRVGLLGFNCKCGGVFCSVHRYADKHGCTFDYKAAGRDAIAKANPLVIAKKIEKI